MTETNFFAVDLGATSGRTVLGSIVDGRLVQRELTRFPNYIIETGGHCYWDIFALYREIIRGLKVVADEKIDIASIGIDTWGVDFVCIGKDGGVLRNPYCYRDPHTDGVMEEYFKLDRKGHKVNTLIIKEKYWACIKGSAITPLVSARVWVLHWEVLSLSRRLTPQATVLP